MRRDSELQTEQIKRIAKLRHYPYAACGPDVVMLLEKLDEAQKIIKNLTATGKVTGVAPDIKVQVPMSAYTDAINWLTSFE